MGCHHHRQLGNYFDSSSVNDEEMEHDFNASFEKEMKMSGAKASFPCLEKANSAADYKVGVE